MSAAIDTQSKSSVATNEEVITKEAYRLYSTMFGKLLEDFEETPSLIFDRLFLGSAPDARDLKKIQRHNIRYVLNMTGSHSYPLNYFHGSGHPNITVLALDAHDTDSYNISVHFVQALNFIHKSLQSEDGAVLVHCSAGVSRSATIVAAYLMVKYQIGATEAVLRVHEARACACPSINFLRQLLRFNYKAFKFE